MDKIDEILKIKELLNSGVITINEFTELKNKLLKNSKNVDAKIKVEIGIDEKECPSCKFIINKNNKTCDFCDYEFPNNTDSSVSKQAYIQEEKEINNINDANKTKVNINSNRNKNKVLLITGILILSLLGLGYYFLKSNKKDNIVPEIKSVSIDTNTNTDTNKISNIQYLINEKIRFDDIIDSNELLTDTVSNYIDDLNSLKFDGSELDFNVYYDYKSHIYLIVEEPRLSMNGYNGEVHKYYFNSNNEIFAQESEFYNSSYNDKIGEITTNNTMLTNYYFDNKLVKSDTIFQDGSENNISSKRYNKLSEYIKKTGLKLSFTAN